jgi:8-oxo-dGTP diphosphatase
MDAQVPKVGIGVIIQNKESLILVGKRQNILAPYYSIPGGKLESGESFEDCAIREIKEETNLLIREVKVVALTNNLETYKNEGRHFISIILFTNKYSGELRNLEPSKCQKWLWIDPYDLPNPHFEPSRIGVSCFLEGVFYKNK